jgi:C4-dicarboxylate-specific signal transduction histidine kinase
MRLETTEDLSGVGLSVETASHDVMLLLSQGINYLNDVINDLENDNVSEMDILDSLKDINKSFANIELLMKDIQILFKSSKQKKHQILVKEYIEKVTRIYSRTMKRENISFEVLEQHNPLVVTCPDAVLLQLLINLFDNAIYWMSIANIPSRKIKIILNGKDGVVIFSDNGPGINEDDILYIFEAFYSGKEVGRGLGLYIAKQLLSRLGYSIGLITKNSEKVLEGANFVIDFNKEDKND